MVSNSSLFFPALARRPEYTGKGEGKKSRYKDYSSEIEEDCKKRCVYCDISLGEHGFEGMVLDHFRPQKHFPELVDDPQNLVLACPKCNRLKWHHWPCEKNIEAPSHNGEIGFINPFNEDRKFYFEVDSKGNLVDKKAPASYMRKLLKLNRSARIQIRRRRIIKNAISLLSQECTKNLEMLLYDLKENTLTLDDAIRDLEFWILKNKKIKEMSDKISNHESE